MLVKRLDHVNVRTTQLDVMIKWYGEVLGMSSGARPDFSFPGAWMYSSDGSAPVHLVGVEGDPGAGSETMLKLEHFAFSASDCTAFEAELNTKGIRYERFVVTDFDVVQINLWDPDGNHIHVDFTKEF